MKEKTYIENFKDLSKIVKDLEQGEIPIDVMTNKIKEALDLLEKCNDALKDVEGDTNKIMEELEEK